MRIEFDEETRVGLVIWIRPDNRIELIAHVPGNFDASDVENLVKALLANILEPGPMAITRIETIRPESHH